MTTSTIDRELASSLEEASVELITRIRQAIDDFYATPPDGWEALEVWRTPKPWETRVLPNLERYHTDLQAALRAYHAGDITRITREAASYAGLSKDLEFDMDWMTEQNQSAVQQAIDRVVMVADRIHRLGYKALTSTGRA